MPLTSTERRPKSPGALAEFSLCQCPSKLQKQQDKIEAQFEKEFPNFEKKWNVCEPFLTNILSLYGACIIINVTEGCAQR